MGFSIVFLLPDFQTDLFYFIFHKFYCLCGVNHSAEPFLFLSDNGFPKISLINVCMWVIAVSVLEQNRFRAGCQQILVRSERLDQSFDSLLFIDIFIVLDFILDQLIDHLHAKQLHRRLVICEDIISFLIFCKI